MPINTTGGAIPRPGERVGHVVNTSDVLEPPQMQYVDEPPEITQVLDAVGWAAAFEDGHQEELLFWCVLDDATIHGVVLGKDGLVDLTEGNVETRRGFRRYKQANSNDKEK